MIKSISYILALLTLTANSAQASEQDKSTAILTAKISQLEKAAQPVGAILQSLVTEAEFQKVYGTNWVVMRGQAIPESQLCKLFKICQLPNASGAFLRTQDTNLGQRQDSVLPNHTHALSNQGGAAIMYFGNSGAGYTDIWSSSDGPQTTYNQRGTNAGGSNGGGSASGASVRLLGQTDGVNSAAPEVRPLNVSVQTYIRIN